MGLPEVRYALRQVEVWLSQQSTPPVDRVEQCKLWLRSAKAAAAKSGMPPAERHRYKRLAFLTAMAENEPEEPKP